MNLPHMTLYLFLRAALATVCIFSIFFRSWANFIAGWRTMPRPF